MYESMFAEITWKEAKCGDIILIKEGDYIPADMVILLSS